MSVRESSRSVLAAGAGLITALSVSLPAQGPGRIATSAGAILSSPLFFHGKQVAVHATVEQTGEQGRLQVPVDEAAVKQRRVPQVFIFWREQPSRTSGEIRGEFWDLGRINADDGRFATYDFKPMLQAVTEGRWPGRDELFVILGATMVESPLPATATLRAIVLAPEQYANRQVTISGRFRGRNLYADLAGPLNKSRWDFVLQSADAAIWISGLQPKGKGFDLDPSAKVDTGRWLQVTGMARTEGTAVWVEAKTVELSTPPQETAVDVDVPPPPKPPPPTVIFSAPIQDETGVELRTDVRIQFSWDMDVKSFRDRIRISYVPAPDGTGPPAPEFTTSYNEGNRALSIKFARPLEPLQTLKVELLDGITAAGGGALKPWVLTFSTGS